MYTIKQAASRSGIPVQLLRAWERRYGVVAPARTDSGYRLYDEPSIARLRAMRQLVDQGWAPSTAAVRILELDDASISKLVSEAPSRAAEAPREPSNGASAESLRQAFVEAASRLDEPAFEQVLDDMFARGSFEQVATELVMPALVELGRGWADGRVDVAGEHAAAGAVQRRIAMAFLAAGAPRDDENLVLVGMPPGGRHDLGALAFATIARRAGIPVRYLGADLPVEDWVEAAKRTNARAVVIGVVVRNDVRAASQVALALRADAPNVDIFLGGERASTVPLDEIRPAVVLPTNLADAVTALRQSLAGPG